MVLNKKFSVLATILILSLSIGIVTAQTPTPSPTPTPVPFLKFSLWFTNGTAYPSIFYNPIISGNYNPDNVSMDLWNPVIISRLVLTPAVMSGDIPVEINLIVLHNDGNTPVTINAQLQNIYAPSNIQISLMRLAINPNGGPYPNTYKQWLGYNNLATSLNIGAGQYLWLGLVIEIGQTDLPHYPIGPPNFTFSYSFDIVVTATSAGLTTYQHAIQVTGTYPNSPTPSPLPTASPTQQPTPPLTPTPTPTAIPTPTPTPTSKPTDTPTITPPKTDSPAPTQAPTTDPTATTTPETPTSTPSSTSAPIPEFRFVLMPIIVMALLLLLGVLISHTKRLTHEHS